MCSKGLVIKIRIAFNVFEVSLSIPGALQLLSSFMYEDISCSVIEVKLSIFSILSVLELRVSKVRGLTVCCCFLSIVLAFDLRH